MLIDRTLFLNRKESLNIFSLQNSCWNLTFTHLHIFFYFLLLLKVDTFFFRNLRFKTFSPSLYVLHCYQLCFLSIPLFVSPSKQANIQKNSHKTKEKYINKVTSNFLKNTFFKKTSILVKAELDSSLNNFWEPSLLEQ